MFWSSDQIRLSGASLEGDWQGVTLRGIQKVEVTDELSRDPMYGNAAISRGLPAGTHKASCSVETLPEEADAILQALGNNFSQVPGSIGLSMSEPNGSGLYVVEIFAIYIDSCAITIEAGGQKGTTKTMKCTVLKPVNWNGLQLITEKAQSFDVDFGGITL